MLVTLYHAVENREFEKVTDHVLRLTGKEPESIENYLRRKFKGESDERNN